MIFLLTHFQIQACQDTDITITERAQLALRQLKNPEARELLCHLVIEQDHPIARQVVIDAHYAPGDPQQRALLYFLTEQWEQYEQFDFDHHFLKTVYPLTKEKVKQRIRKIVRKTGRLEFVTMLVGEHRTKRIGELTDADWKMTLLVLTQRQAGQEMWRLAQISPAIWSVRLLQQLFIVGWKPGVEPDQAEFEKLIWLARECAWEGGSKLDQWWYHQATLKGHTDTVRCVTISPDGRRLVSGSYDNTVRLWRLPKGGAIRILTGYTGRVECVAISPDGRLLVSGSGDGTIRLWVSYRVLLIPDEQIRRDDIAWVQQMLQISDLPDDKRKWLEFLVTLYTYRHQYDIEIEAQTIPIGEFDIEIDDPKHPNLF